MESTTEKGGINDDMAEKFANERARNKVLTLDIDKLTKELNKQNETIKALTAGNDKLKNELKTLTSENDRLEKELSTQKDVVKTLTGENIDITNERDNLKKDRDKQRKTIMDITLDNGKLMNALKALTLERDNLKKELNIKNETVNSLTTMKNNQAKDIKDLQGMNDEYLDTIAAHERDWNRVKALLDTYPRKGLITPQLFWDNIETIEKIVNGHTD